MSLEHLKYVGLSVALVCLMICLLPKSPDKSPDEIKSDNIMASVDASPVDLRDIRENCRLLSIVSASPPNLDAMATALKGFCRPTYPQNSGWSLAAYSDFEEGGLLGVSGEPMIIRTQRPILYDTEMWNSATDLILRLEPTLVMGHLRNASSGCSYIADPHPFVREYDGRTFLLIHNGGVWDKDLDYLVDHLIYTDDTPRNCPGDPIDSEYLFIYLMQLIEEFQGDVWPAFSTWAHTLTDQLGDDWNALNIVLTDGHLIWAARISYRSTRFSLHYAEFANRNGFGVSTQKLGPEWIPLPNYTIAEFNPGHPIYYEELPHPVVSGLDRPYPITMPTKLTYAKPE